MGGRLMIHAPAYSKAVLIGTIESFTTDALAGKSSHIQQRGKHSKLLQTCKIVTLTANL